MIFKGSPLTSTIYYGKKLHERGHQISLLISREWADVADYSHLMTNDSFYTTYIFSCGDDFKAMVARTKNPDYGPDRQFGQPYARHLVVVTKFKMLIHFSNTLSNFYLIPKCHGLFD